MADELEGARTLPVKFRDQGDGSAAEILAVAGDTEGSAVASGARTGNQGWNLTNPGARGLMLYLSIPSAGSGTLTLGLRAGPSFNNKLVAFPGLSGGSGRVFCIYPGAADSAEALIDFFASFALPRTVRVYVEPSDGSSWTYAIDYSWLR